MRATRAVLGGLALLAAGGCRFFTAEHGPYVLNELAPAHRDGSGTDADWVEVCNRGTEDRPLKGWRLRLEVNGQETTLHEFGDDDVLYPGRHNIIGPGNTVPDVHAAFDVPVTPARAVLKLYDADLVQVDALAFTLGAATRAAVTRRCDCESRGDDDGDVRVADLTAATPGAENFGGGCVHAVPPPGSGSSSASSSSGGAVPDAGAPQGCSAAGCHPMWPVDAAGRTWTYTLASSSGSGTQVMETLAALRVRTSSNADGNTATVTQDYQCASNVLSQVALQMETTANGVTTTSSITPASPVDVLRANMATGTSFNQSVQAQVLAQTPLGPINRTVTLQSTVTVEAEEDVVVPEGTVRALRIRQHLDVGGSVQDNVGWYVLGRGPVKLSTPPPWAQPGSNPAPLNWQLTACEF
ncbi:MAG: lamin tail domain-containing protein [Deltaproteobacteria bacterium]|nr:lamin tail domain-containing protein [Deltaproteobacteria bacterium]